MHARCVGSWFEKAGLERVNETLARLTGSPCCPRTWVTGRSSLVVETIDPVRDPAHFQGFPERLDEHDQSPDESGPGPAFRCRSEQRERGRVFASTSHISS